jgi:hypothetical protein
MPRRGHSPEQILNKLRQVEVSVANGKTVALSVREIGVTEVTLTVDSPIHVSFSLYLFHLIFESQARAASKLSTAFRCMVGVT